MAQTLLVICALACALVLSLSARKATHHRTAASQRGEVEVRIVQLGADLLDRAEALPFAPDGAAPAPDGTFDGAAALTDLDGLDEVLEVDGDAAPVPVRVRVEVDTVAKSGATFQAVHTDSPFRRVRLGLTSALGTAVDLERIYTSR